MSTNPEILVRDMNHMQISQNYGNQQYSAKKVAPMVPPKPKANDSYTVVNPKANGIYHTSSAQAQPQVASTSNTPGCGPIYSNVQMENDALPPPPPPQHPQYGVADGSQSFIPYSTTQMSQYHHQMAPTTQYTSSTPAEDGMGPSDASSYEPSSGYAAFRPQSSASSYDTSSIYEPITPRPPSQMSNRSNYSIGSGGSSLYSSYNYPPRGKTMPGTGKEAEVDRLTDLMVQNLENSGDPDFHEVEEEEEEMPVIGMCHQCGEKVLGEGNGCTTMDRVYHIACFSCYVCGKGLRGKPFYSKEGKPYCEEDYLNTLEKCCVCGERILDRILRATGKPYHPGCFTCVMCGKGLDGIPFTVDATNQIYCIDDFHKKFAPRCCVCMKPIMPEAGKEETVRVVALDRSFHVQCYCCEDCGLRLSSDAETTCYPLDDHILCRSCNAKRVQALTSSIITEL